MYLSDFCKAKGGRQVLVTDPNTGRPCVVKAGLSKTAERAVHCVIGEKWYGTTEERQQNLAIKAAFLDALESTIGPAAATKACREAGLDEHWEATSKPISGRAIQRVLGYVPRITLGITQHNEFEIARYFEPSTGDQPGFADVYKRALVKSSPIAGGSSHIEFEDLFRREIAQRTGFGEYLIRSFYMEEVANLVIGRVEKRHIVQDDVQRLTNFARLQRSYLSENITDAESSLLPRELLHTIARLISQLTTARN